jgi:MFS family permease
MNPSRPAGPIRINLYFWFLFISTAAFVPFSGLYYKSVFEGPHGESAIGVITLLLVLQPLMSLISNPVAGYLADRFKLKDKTLFFCALLCLAGGLLIGLPGFGIFPGLAPGARLALMAAGIIVTGIFSGPVFPIMNTETLDHVHARGEGEGSYGRHRVHGSLSWIVFTAVVGVVLSLSGELSLIAVFYCTGYLLLALTALSGARGRVNPVRLPLEKLFRDKPFRRVIVFNMLQSFALYGSLFFSGYVFSEAKLDYLGIGLAFALGAVIEIPIMFYARRLFARLGNRTMVMGGTALLTLKVLLLGLAMLAQLPWLIVPVMLIHGAGFASQYMGIINLIDETAHKDLRATYLNLYTVIGVNIPTAAGILFSGWLIRAIGGPAMMLVNSGVAVLAIVYFFFFVKAAPAPGKAEGEVETGT